MTGLRAERARAALIARLNDRARQAMGIACAAATTTGFRALPASDQSRVRELIETFDRFTPGNDPTASAISERYIKGAMAAGRHRHP